MEFRRSPVIGLSGMQYNISELGFGIQHIHTIHMVCVFNDPTLYWRLRIVNCVKSDMKASSDLVFNFFYKDHVSPCSFRKTHPTQRYTRMQKEYSLSPAC